MPANPKCVLRLLEEGSMIRRAGTSLLLGLLCVPGTTYAHHSVGANFDVGNIIEVEGEVTQISWRNPHVRLVVTVRADNGEEELWGIETNSVSILRRMDVSADVLTVGERVRIAGNPARRGGNELFESHHWVLRSLSGEQESGREFFYGAAFNSVA